MAEEVTYLASFSGEIGTKRAGTQKALKELTLENLSARAEVLGLSLKVEEFRGRLKISSSQREVERLLLTHFGLGRVAPYFRITPEFDWQALLPARPFTFEIYVDRWQSPELKQEALALKRRLLSLFEAEAEKRLTLWDNHPPAHLRLFLEAWEEGIFLLKDPQPAAGGFPVGSGGRVLLLFSGGPDSLLAAWLLLRRGLEVTLLFFDDEEEGRAELVELAARKLAFFIPRGEMLLVHHPFRKHLLELKDSVPERERCFYCKSLMLEIGRDLLPKVPAGALATGEILGEQASQTLPALQFINFGKDLVLRPVLAFTKEEVFGKLTEVGLEKIATRRLPACPFAPERPRTAPRKDPSKAAKILRKLARIPARPAFKILKYRREDED
ncbi:MAG: hypothetical protein GXO20_00475 [Thermodesulfobacteria bacterium]|nr:hypothetical protein [Thermodesulfobacteriota bacterium]